MDMQYPQMAMSCQSVPSVRSAYLSRSQRIGGNLSKVSKRVKRAELVIVTSATATQKIAALTSIVNCTVVLPAPWRGGDTRPVGTWAQPVVVVTVADPEPFV